MQLCGLKVSVSRQYYHLQKRANESPLEYLHRRNVAGLGAKLRVKSGQLDVRREHVEHFIETLDDRDLANQPVLLCISDADTLKKVLRARQRTKTWQDQASIDRSLKP
ncbi:hypothetical protein PC116_g6594 [Phytophthora cactorum]|nr:hypothetical protein PC116_g6594 [Phytophthora cactorum]